MKLPRTKSALSQYFIITGNYWAFTLTDGALRMLIVLHFHALGYSPFAIAMLFVFYEIFGVITNLIGGWLGSLIGLNKTMNIGLFIQIAALAMLLVPDGFLNIFWVMTAQALSGIAKDLNKMSAKSAIKLLVPKDANGKLYKWISLLTGSKNALKGVGFFIGGLLLTLVGFKGAIAIMAATLLAILLLSFVLLTTDLGTAKSKPKFKEIFSKSSPVNYLSAGRLFLFGARDIWFVIAAPVFLATQFGWDHSAVGGFFALWIIGYGLIQSLAPIFTGNQHGQTPDGRLAFWLVFPLTFVPLVIAGMLYGNITIEISLIAGLLIFGVLFALNSAVHSFLIVDYAREDGVSLDVGFYYMANAMGRLLGTLLSGWLYQNWGIESCLLGSGLFLAMATLISFRLPKRITALKAQS